MAFWIILYCFSLWDSLILSLQGHLHFITSLQEQSSLKFCSTELSVSTQYKGRPLLPGFQNYFQYCWIFPLKLNGVSKLYDETFNRVSFPSLTNNICFSHLFALVFVHCFGTEGLSQLTNLFVNPCGY